MNKKLDYSDLDNGPRVVETSATPVTPRPVSGFSVFALVLSMLAIPAALMPLIGIAAALVALVVSIVATVMALRSGTPRTYAMIALGLAIIAMGMAIFFTTVGLEATRGCETLRGDELAACMEENTRK